MIDLAAAPEFSMHEEALWWLNHKRGNDWKSHGVLALMKKHGLIEEKPLVSAVSPEPPAESTLPPVAEVLLLNGDAKAGQAAVAVCYSCHKLGNQGVEFGPDLTQFGKTQPREVIVNAILKPSAEISHGFEGTRVETNDGVVIDGIALGEEDPLGIKSVGGLAQSVPRDRIKSVNPLGRSLMLAPELMGLTPQAIVDIVAYLQAAAGQK
jgi:putative heme-binding domain-containing protein